MNLENSISSLAYSNPTKASSTETSIFNEGFMNHNNHRLSHSAKRYSDEIFQSVTKKTKKKQIVKIVEEDIPKVNAQNIPQSAPLIQKKKRGPLPLKNLTQNVPKLVTNLGKVDVLKKTNNLNKQTDKDSQKSNSNGRGSFMSQSSLSSFRSNSSQNRKQVLSLNKNGLKSNSQDREQNQSSKNPKGSANNFGSAFTSIKTNGKNAIQQINPAEKKYQEDKKKYELQLKLIRVKNQEFAKKCKSKPIDWKKMQKAQAKQKVQEKIGLSNEGLRLQQNMQKTISDIEQEQANIIVDYNNVSDEMKARYTFFEETIAPYEKKMQNDINLRNQLLQKTVEQQNQLDYQKQINSNIQEDNSSLSLQSLLLMEQITALKAKKQQLLDNQAQIDNENKQLKENADLKQQHLNILQKHYDEQASRSLWLKKEINLKKKGIFHINIISEKKMNVLKNDMEEDLTNNSSTQQNNSSLNSSVSCNQSLKDQEMQQEKQEEKQVSDEGKNYHYTCSINYLLQNEFELLRSIADFEYFTPNQIYGFFYSDNSYLHQLNLLQKFMTFFSSSKIRNSHLVIYNNEGVSNFEISNSDTSFESIIDTIKKISKDDSLLSPNSYNLGFTLHLDILNQQFYLGKQFNVLITGINQSTSSQNTLMKLKSLFATKKIPQIDHSTSDNSLLLGTIQTNTNNQLSELMEKLQKQLPLNTNQQTNKSTQSNKNNDQMINEHANNDVNNGAQLSVQQLQQNQQIKAIKKVKYNDIQPMINKNVKTININQGTPKAQRKKDILNQTSNNRSGTIHTTGRRSQSEDRSGVKAKEKKLLENLNKIIDGAAKQEEKVENKNLINYIYEFFKKTNRLYTVHFDSHFQFSTQI